MRLELQGLIKVRPSEEERAIIEHLATSLWELPHSGIGGTDTKYMLVALLSRGRGEEKELLLSFAIRALDSTESDRVIVRPMPVERVYMRTTGRLQERVKREVERQFCSFMCDVGYSTAPL